MNTDDRVQTVMAEQQLTQVEFAKVVGIAQSALNKILKGGTLTRLVAQSIELKFGYRAEWLLKGEFPKKRDVIEHLSLDDRLLLLLFRNAPPAKEMIQSFSQKIALKKPFTRLNHIQNYNEFTEFDKQIEAIYTNDQNEFKRIRMDYHKLLFNCAEKNLSLLNGVLVLRYAQGDWNLATQGSSKLNLADKFLGMKDKILQNSSELQQLEELADQLFQCNPFGNMVFNHAVIDKFPEDVREEIRKLSTPEDVRSLWDAEMSTGDLWKQLKYRWQERNLKHSDTEGK